MQRYFVEIPCAPTSGGDLLVAGVREFWGTCSLVHLACRPRTG